MPYQQRLIAVSRQRERGGCQLLCARSVVDAVQGAGAWSRWPVTHSRRPYLVLPGGRPRRSLVEQMLDVPRCHVREPRRHKPGCETACSISSRARTSGAKWWRAEFLRVGVDAVDFVERRGRYCSAVVKDAAACAIACALLPRTTTKASRSVMSLRDRGDSDGDRCGVAVAMRDAGSTSNGRRSDLAELIAAPLYFFAVAIVTAFNVELVLRARRSVVSSLVTIVVSVACSRGDVVPAERGLEQHIQDSFAFSGTQFFLGPDRQHGLSRATLFARWAVVYAAGVCVIVAGAWIAEAIVGGVRAISGRPGRSVAPGRA